MKKVPINLPVDLWNALKFVVLQVLVSWIFADTWSMFVSRRAKHLLQQNRTVSILSTNLGRLSPAGIIHVYRSGTRFNRVSARCFVLFVNITIIAFALLTEYGSDSVMFESTEPLFVAGRLSIQRSQKIWNARILKDKKAPPFLLLGELRATALRAFIQDENSQSELPTYKLREHLIDENSELAFQPDGSNDVVLNNVCGIDWRHKGKLCAAHVTNTIGLPELRQRKFSSALLFNVTAHLPIELSEIRGETTVRSIVGVHLITLYPNATSEGASLPTPVDLTERKVSGVCSAETAHHEGADALFPQNFGSLQLCVLTDDKDNTYIVSRTHSVHFQTDLVEHLTTRDPFSEGSWTEPGSIVGLGTNVQNILTFHTSEAPPPLFALVSALRLEPLLVKESMQKELRDLPVGRYLRRNLILRVLGVVGDPSKDPYYERSKMRVSHKNKTVAAVDMLFFAGLALLCTTTAVLAIVAFASRARYEVTLPVGTREGLMVLKQLSCKCDSWADDACDKSTLPSFCLKEGNVNVVCRNSTISMIENPIPEEYD